MERQERRQRIIQLARELGAIVERYQPRSSFLSVIDSALETQEYKSMLRIFGGMGSLNDLYISNSEGRQTFERLRAELFAEMKDSE